MSTSSSPETDLALSTSVETSKLIVTQPAKMRELNDLLMTFESFSNKVSEQSGEDRSGDLGGAGSGTGTKGAAATKGQSARDLAIAAVATDPLVLQKQIQTHIKQEVEVLSKQAKALAHTSNKPGAAHQLNNIYARIRRLNSLLASILEASYDVLKRIFVRVFIDKQPVL